MHDKINAIIWNEFVHEREHEAVKAIYPQGIHETLADCLRSDEDFSVGTATLDQREHGLDAKRLDDCDVLLWWGHMAHDKVSDEVVDRVQKRVLEGMGLVVLHSGHFSKIFRRLMGTNCSLQWREAEETERLWVLEPSHPIAAGLPPHFEIPYEEMYGECFDVPSPDETVFLSWFEGGNVFRSGCCWNRGHGRVFYFRPGHETYPTYFDPNVRKVIVNAARWAARADARRSGAPRIRIVDECPNVPVPLNEIKPKAVRFAKAGVVQKDGRNLR